MDNVLKAYDCEGQEIKVGMKVEGAMSEVLIMGIEGQIEEIQFDKSGEPFGKIKGHEGYWHLRQFVIVEREPKLKRNL